MSIKIAAAALLLLATTALPALAEDPANDAANPNPRIAQQPLFAGAVATKGLSISLHQAQVLGLRDVEEHAQGGDPALASPMLRGAGKEASNRADVSTLSGAAAGSSAPTLAANRRAHDEPSRPANQGGH